MDNRALIQTLVELMQEDFNAARACEEAITRLDRPDRDLRDTLTIFVEDHNRHVSYIANVICKIGGKPPAIPKNIREYAAGTVMSFSEVEGTYETLSALVRYELSTIDLYLNAIYKNTEFDGYPEDVRILLHDNLKDEQRHLKYIESVMKVSPVSLLGKV